ncbi:MAG: GNAT family N-acetyltransferase [Hyphomonadaceae bacterium]|nr:GNAT family N-acetyltransferase [Hyphomonadaceae bacterium]
MTSSGFDRAPVVETERLRLRAHTAADFAASLPIWNDPIVTRFIGGRPYTPEEVWQRVQRYAGSWVLLGHGFWAIEEIATGRVIGEIGIMDAKREMEPPFGDDRELGWALMPGMHGKGYASEALQAVLDWERRVFGADCLVALIDPDNAPSIKLAYKFGFQERTRTFYKGVPSIQFELRRQA